MTPRDLALGALALLSAALVAAIALELTAAPAPAPESAPPARTGDLPAAVADDTPTLVPIILARPLFSTDRRPKAAPSTGGEPTDELPRLAGIMIDGPQKHAIFQPSGDAKPITAVVGDQVAGWRVQQITVASVTLDGPGGTRTLEPKADPSLVPPAAPSAPVAPVVPNPGQVTPRQYLPGGMQLPPGVPNPFAGQGVPQPGRPVAPQLPVRQQGGAPAAPNRR
jgi:hypothetical protein